MEMTAEQRSAAEIRGKNILVNAAAGSGKTKVLTERIIGIISDKDNPVDIDALLIVTFTKAAAREMRERISGALTKKVLENPSDRHLKKQLILLNNADITTIDAFCLDVVKSNFHRLDIDPSFSIISDGEEDILRDEITDEVFEENYARADKSFLDIAERYSDNNKDEYLRGIIRIIYDHLSSSQNIDREINRMRRLYCEPFDEGGYKGMIYGEMLNIINEIIKKYYIAVDILSKYPEDNKSLKKTMPIIQDELDKCICIKQKIENGEWDNAAKIYNSIKFDAASWTNLDPVHKPPINAPRDMLKNISSLGYFAYTENILKEKINGCYKDAVSAFLDLAKEFSDKYMEKKRSINKFEFSDIERMCLELLYDENGEKSDVCLELREKYYEILIDEYQDSNGLQEDIFSSISNGHNMFMVGDMKQSIYAFRNSDPMLFKSKCSFPSDPLADSCNVKVVLSKNFRSGKECIDAVNELFSGIMSEECGEIDYDDEQRLYQGNMNYDETQNPPQLMRAEFDIIDMSDTPDSGENENADEEEDIDKLQTEARYAAKRILELKASGYMTLDKNTNTYRPLENKDIAVLTHTRKAAAVYAEELNKCGISTYAQSSGYFNKPEVRIILSLLEIINNPLCDIPFIAVMCSVIYGITEETLAQVHIYDRKKHIYENIVSMLADGIDGTDSTKKSGLKRLAEDIEQFRDYAKYMPCDKLIWTIYEQTGFYNICAAMSGGEEKCANLLLLFERARTFENSGFKGLFNFIRLIKRLIRKANSGSGKSNDMNEACLINESHNVVNAMTIHKSKGLEFPVVILSQASKKFNTDDLKNPVIIDKTFGIGINYREPEKYYYYPTIIKRILTAKKKNALVSEQMRVLYVALTRAREKLIVLSAEKKAPSKDAAEYKDARDANSFYDWILPYAAHGNYWDMNIIPKSDALDFTPPEEIISENTGEEIDISDIFAFEYKYKNAIGLDAKISVTELKRRAAENEDGRNIFADDIIVQKPAFLRDSRITPSQKGSVMHAFMQNIILKRDMDEKYLEEEIARLSECGIFTEKESGYIDKNKILLFFASDIGRRMLNADKVYREMRFEIPINASALNSGIQNESILLQGIIDCYFEEDDGIVLIDYKTDYYTDKNEIKKKYALQLEYYKKAIEILTKKNVKDTYLYLFFNNDVV